MAIPIISCISIHACLSIHALENSRGLSELSIWHCVRVRALISFFQKCRAFLIQETVNSFLLVFSGI